MMRAVGLGVQHLKACPTKLLNDVTDGLIITAHMPGYYARRFLTRTGEHNLAPPHFKAVFRMEASF